MASKKQSQRTKGNLRPSSSGRAAELLVGTGGSASGFLGFSALSGDLGYVPVTGTDDIDTDADADFRMVMRKLSKKDVTTKIKALQEFATLCKEKDAESVKTVLLYWPRLYNKLVLDVDRRVREATQKAFEQLLLKVERSIAPHLKLLMGAWLMAQNDTYATAASAAQSAFACAFIPAKQPGAVMFCKDEVLLYLTDNLLNQTKQTLSDAKTTAPEDMESKYHRVIMSSLLALKMFISLVPVDKQCKMENMYEQLLSDNKFWKLLKISQNMVTGAFYALLATFCEENPPLANKYASKICPAVLHNLDMTSPAVCPALWNSALLIITNIENCWEYVNLRKAVLPKLWTVLTSGGDGSAHVIYPNLLPFLSKLPSEVTTWEFYELFFDHMKTGLLKDRVLLSPSECSAAVTAFMECLQYCVSQTSSVDDGDRMTNLVKQRLLPVLSESLTDKRSVLANSPLYQQCAVFINALVKQTEDINDKEVCHHNQQMIDIFWAEIGQLYEEVLNNDQHLQKLDRLKMLLFCFKTGAADRVCKQKSGVSVRFQEQTEELELVKTELPTKSSSDWRIDATEQFRGLVSNTCASCIQAYKDNASLNHLKLASELLQSFSEDFLYTRILSLHNVPVADSVPLAMQLCTHVFIPWITRLEDTVANFNDVIRCLMKMTLSVVSTVPLVDKREIMANLCTNISSVEVFQLKTESMIASSDRDIKSWLKSDVFGKRLTEFVKCYCQSISSADDGGDAKWNLLKLTFTVDNKGDPLVCEEYLGIIINDIQHALPSSTSADNIETSVTFVCNVTQIIIPTVQNLVFMQSVQYLILELFKLSVEERLVLSSQCKAKVEETWLMGIKAFVDQTGGLNQDGGLINMAANIIKTCLLTVVDSTERLSRLIATVTKVADVINCTLDEKSMTHQIYGPTTMLFLKSLLQSTSMSQTSVGKWHEWPIIQGQVTFNIGEVSDDQDIPTIPQGALLAAFNLSLLQNCLTEDDDEIWLKTVMDACYWRGLCAAIKSSKRKEVHTEAEKLLMLADPVLSTILEEDSISDKHNTLLKLAVDRSLEEGGAWCLVPSLLTKQGRYLDKDIFSLLGGTDRISTLSAPVLNTFLSISTQLTIMDREQLTDVLAAKIISLESDSVDQFHGGIGCLLMLDHLLESASDDVIKCVIAEVRLWRDQHEQLFLFCNSLDKCHVRLVAFNSAVMSLFSSVIQYKPVLLSDSDWDFILCNTVSWCQSCAQSTDSLRSEFTSHFFTTRLSQLIQSLVNFMTDTILTQKDVFPSNLSTEWEEFFSEGIFSVIFPLYVDLTEKMQETLGYETMMQQLGGAVSSCPVSLLLSHQLPARLVADDDTNLPDDIQTLMNHLTPLLLSNMSCLQLTAYKLLHRVLPELVQYDDMKAKDDEEDKIRSPPSALMTTLDTACHVVDHILTTVQIGETMVIEPYIDEYTFTTAYLLSWQLLLGYFRDASSELRVEYAAYLQRSGILRTLLTKIFCLMPENPASVEKPKLLFCENPDTSSSVEPTVSWLQHLACHTCYQTMKCLPALVRSWWTDLDKNASSYCNGYISKHISPLLTVSEIEAVNSKDTNYDNMTIKARAGAGEVLATYTVEECSMELVIKLAVNHPLTPVTVECSKRVGVAQSQWRKWMLQLTAFLAHQNGSLVNGLAMWKQNLDKHFSGVEECMICFSVIHGSNYHLPKLQCKTCKKKYHSACLYKWFNTSNNSSCPLCRNLF